MAQYRLCQSPSTIWLCYQLGKHKILYLAAILTWKALMDKIHGWRHACTAYWSQFYSFTICKQAVENVGSSFDFHLLTTVFRWNLNGLLFPLMSSFSWYFISTLNKTKRNDIANYSSLMRVGVWNTFLKKQRSRMQVLILNTWVDCRSERSLKTRSFIKGNA